MKTVRFSDIVKSIGDIGYYIGTEGEFKNKLLATTIDYDLMGMKRNGVGYDGHKIDLKQYRLKNNQIKDKP